MADKWLNKYPKYIYHGSEKYRILFVKDLDCFGETDSGAKTIKIKSGMSDRETMRTMIHELLHLIEFESGIKLKHKKVYALEEAIFNLIVDNFL